MWTGYRHYKRDYGVVVKAFCLYWGGIRFESISTHNWWALSKSFVPSWVVWSMTKNNAFGGGKQNKKSNDEQSDLCDLEQVTLKPQLQVHHYLTTWLQIWYQLALTTNNGELRELRNWYVVPVQAEGSNHYVMEAPDMTSGNEISGQNHRLLGWKTSGFSSECSNLEILETRIFKSH